MLRLTATRLDQVIKQTEKYASEEPHEKTFKQCMHEAKGEARILCPYKTGYLRNSIYIRKMNALQYEFGFTVYYGVYWEFGTYAIRAGSVESPAANYSGYCPFMRPALWRTIKKYPEYYKQAIRIK